MSCIGQPALESSADVFYEGGNHAIVVGETIGSPTVLRAKRVIVAQMLLLRYNAYATLYADDIFFPNNRFLTVAFRLGMYVYQIT